MFSDDFRDRMRIRAVAHWKAVEHLIVLIGLLGSVVTLGNWAFGETVDYTVQGAIGIFFLGCYALYLVIAHHYTIVTWGRDRRYSHVLATLNQGFARIHNTLDEDKDGRVSLREGLRACIDMCDAVESAFSHISQTTCSACVKVVVSQGTNPPTVHAIARDSRSRERRSRNDRDQTQKQPMKHPIEQNTAFKSILEHIDSVKRLCFLENNLPREARKGRYTNTSFATYRSDQSNKSPSLADGEPWPLPYSSTLVVPIYPNTGTSPGVDDIVGFLCVDSPALTAFREQHDVVLAQGVADALHTLLTRILDDLDLDQEP